MSGAAPDHEPGALAPPTTSESRDGQPAAKAAWWRIVAQAYQRRPLLYGFFTLLALALLAATVSPFFSGVDPAPTFVGQPRTPAAQLRAIAESLGHMDEFGQAAYAERLRDSLNPWLRQLRPTGTWESDPYLLFVMPQSRDAAFEHQRLMALITAKEKSLGGKQGPTVPDEAAKERTAVAEMRRKLQTLAANLGQFRQKMTQDLALASQTFSIEDALVIEGAVWARDISNRLRNNLAQRRGKVDRLELAQELFDWTIRNIALDERDQPTTELAWESLLWGQASNSSRAWIFMELCRQQDLDVVMLAYRDPKGGYKDWLPAVYLEGPDSSPNLYLFDHRWGIPIPGPAGQGVATLAQVMESPDVLAQLDAVRTYGVGAEQLKEVVARVDISPRLLSRRMQILETELHAVDRDHLVLSLDLSRLASRLRKVKGLSNLEAWPWPAECQANSRRAPPAALRSTFALFALAGVEEKSQRSKKLEEEHRKQREEENKKALDQENKPKTEEELAAAEARPGEGEPPITLETVQREQREKKVPGFLWRGRMLEFRGDFSDVDDRTSNAARSAADVVTARQGAANVYHSGRMTDRELDVWHAELATDLPKALLLRDAMAAQGASARDLAKADFTIAHIQSQLAQFPAIRLERRFARLLATYCLAQVAYERGNYTDAAGYFRQLRDKEAPALARVLDELAKDNPSANDLEKALRQQVELVLKPKLDACAIGANYNLARALEAEGRDAEAIQGYRADTSAQRYGSLYRARRLEQKAAAAAKATKAAEGRKGADGPKPKDGQSPAL